MVLIFEDENFFGDSGGAEADAAAESGAHNKAPSADGAHVRHSSCKWHKTHTTLLSYIHDTIDIPPPLSIFGVTSVKEGH